MIETSIIMSHYSEDKKRENIARRCIQAVQPHRNKTTEFILLFNGHYPYRDEFIKYCDQWHERDADISPGRGANIATKMAKGDFLFRLCNDVLLYPGAVEECVRLMKKYPKNLISPQHMRGYKMKHWGKELENGHMGCDRAGDIAVCITKKQIKDIGPHDEVCCLTDGINYTNRRIAKGYTVLLTKEPMCKDLAPGIHSFKKQMKTFKFIGYKNRTPVYSKKKLIELSYETIDTDTK